MIREFQDEILRLRKQLNSASSGARSEKVVVEKVKEVIVEKERIVNRGPTESDMKAIETQLAQETQQIKAQLISEKKRLKEETTIAVSEKKKLLTDLEHKERELEAQNKQQGEMIQKLKHMEGKMLIGSQVMEKALQQENELRRTEKVLQRKQRAEDRLRKQTEQVQEENVDLRLKFSSHEEEARRLTGKLEQLWNRYRQAQQEIVDIQQEFQTEQSDLLSSLRELQQEIEVKNLIINNFIPPEEAHQLTERAVWNPEDDEWIIESINVADKPLVRPKSALGLRMPMTEYARINMAMGDNNPRFRYENVLVTDLEMTEGVTQYYNDEDPNGIHEAIAAALCFALAPDDADIDAFCTPTSPVPVNSDKKKKKKKEKDAPERRKEDAFPQARGLVSRQSSV